MTIQTPAFDPNRFSSAASHYFARAGYAPRLIEHVIDAVQLGTDDRVMDLGCGPGDLAIAIAPHVAEVVAVDPAAEMLEAARKAAAGNAAGNIRFVLGSSNDLGLQHGRFTLVTMGRSFHWMDRAETLRRLDAIVEREGAIALFNLDAVNEGADDWHREYEQIAKRYAAGPATWRSPDFADHSAFLIDSTFSRIEGLSVTERVSFPAAQLVDRTLSRSLTTPDALGPEKTAALAEEIAAFANKIAVAGMISEIIRSNATIARRP